jgi:hypothetical protein
MRAMMMLLALVWTVQAHGQELVAPPALPFSPYGIVAIDGENVPDGTVIEALCGGTNLSLM